MPDDLLALLLQDHSTGRNIIWATDDYAARGDGFGVSSEITTDRIRRDGDAVIRPRIDKSPDEQRRRVTQKAEVFTPSWLCNVQNNQVDAVWFGLHKDDSSPFNAETPDEGLGWKTTPASVKFTKEKPWLDYVLAPRLEVACGEAPYLTSRYDAVSGRKISVPDRVGLLDRKLRVVTENVRDPQDWLHYAKRAVQNIYGFDWQGDNVLLARENIVATVIETFTHVFCGGEISDFASFRVFPPIEDEGGDLGLDFAADTVVDDGCARLSHLYLLELAEIVSWNIWQMDGLKFVAPMSCHLEKRLFKTSGGETVTLVSECPGCEKGDNARHNGVYCRVMDWATGRSAAFRDLLGDQP